jgi:hypothetical protein
MVSDVTTSPKDKSLAHFFETVYRNQQGNRDRFPERYRIIQRVDDCFAAAGKNLGDAQPIFTGPMFLRSQYAYKAAAGMTLAGQFSESFVLMRSCLEYAGYALLIFTDPRLEEIFLNRHADDASKNVQRRTFEISTITKAIAGFDKKLSHIFKYMYDCSIDFGGHPNPHAMIGSMNIDKDDDEQLTSMSTFGLAINPQVIEFALHKVAQVGSTSLSIFDHMFGHKFGLLGIRAEMEALRESGL